MSLLALLANLDAVLDLIEKLKSMHENAETDKTIKENLITIKKAFDAKDSSILDSVFNE